MTLDRIFGQPSARVVALARVGLATVFLMATLADPKVGQSPAVIPILAGFFAFSGVVAVLTWRSWWIDARLAIVAHLTDIAFFTAMVALPDGYSSPYFLFFVFLLLSSAIRWDWKETTLTALVVVMLYAAAGLAFAISQHSQFEARRFLIRCGYLVVLSAVLVWFGMRRRFSRGRSLFDRTSHDAVPDESLLGNALRQVTAVTKAKHAFAVWKFLDGSAEAATANNKQYERAPAGAEMLSRLPENATLFDTSANRALVNTSAGRRNFTTPAALLTDQILERVPGTQGLAIPVRSALGEGLFVLWGIEDLHSDHLPLGERMQSEIAYTLDHFTVVSALRDSAIARERLSLARDLHDGVVQFLAGSAYRIESISQSSAEGSNVSNDLQELKQLMLIEQEDLRSSIGALRGDATTLDRTAFEAQALCERLSRQWHVACSFKSQVSDARITPRLRADMMNMIKESVANASRHASARNVEVGLMGNGRTVELQVRNDGQAKNGRDAKVPWSIKERLTEIGGTASISSADGHTTLLVVMPMGDSAQ